MTGTTDLLPLLAQGAAELGLTLPLAQLKQFELYFRELADWNRRVNLTSVADYEGVQVKHFLDSLTLLPALNGRLADGLRVVDVGAGGGFPGLPLKLVFPQIRLALVEATGKKSGFLRHAARSLGLEGVEVYTGRAEELAHRPELRAAFDLALARGLARLPALLEYTLPFAKPGGRVAAWKHGGDNLRAELTAARRALRLLGGRVESIHKVSAAGLTDNRVVLLVGKTRSTPEAYPRRPGTPTRQPL